MDGTGDGKALLEGKMRSLEQRLVLVERFVEMRFCETFRDFAVRNLSPVSVSSVVAISGSSENGRKGQGQTGGKRVTVPVHVSTAEEAGEFMEEDSLVSPPPPPASPPPVEEDDVNPTAYRTRSGRKSTRLTATALGVRTRTEEGPSGSKAPVGCKQKTKAPEKNRKLSNSRKLLRVTLARLEEGGGNADNDSGGEGAGGINDHSSEQGDKVEGDVEVEPEIIKMCVKNAEEGDPLGEEQDDGDYFMFPSGEDHLEGEEGGDNPEFQMESAGGDDRDGDWNPAESDAEDDDDNDKDFEVKPSTSGRKYKSTACPLLTSDASGGTSTSNQKRRKYIVPSSMKLLPKGVQLQIVNPDQANLKSCPVCHIHTKANLMDRHMKTHVAERHLQCSKCDMRFFGKNTLRKHMKRHQANHRTKKCRLCEKAFETSYHVLQHERFCIKKRLEKDLPVDPGIVEDVRQKSQGVELKWPDPNEKIPEGMRKCTHCKEFIEETVYFKHLTDKHARWKCTFCGKMYVEKSGLVRHLCNAHGENRISCELCQNTFESREAYRSHNERCRKENKKRSKETEADSGEPENS